jgi:hypothetical protein
LVEWRVAEREGLWGEMAANYRTEYAIWSQIAASDGYTLEARRAASARAEMLRRKLFGAA